jgi:hypothetical protein
MRGELLRPAHGAHVVAEVLRAFLEVGQVLVRQVALLRIASCFASSMNIVPMKLPTPREPECSMNHTKPASSRQTSMKWLPVPSVPRCLRLLVFASFG